MSDILIRNVPDSLKVRLADAAERAGRSVSDEAIEILATSLGGGRAERSALTGKRVLDEKESFAVDGVVKKDLSMGDRIRVVLGEERFTEEELQAIADVRRDPIRGEPPSFDK